jgi:hypothetical protein
LRTEFQLGDGEEQLCPKRGNGDWTHKGINKQEVDCLLEVSKFLPLLEREEREKVAPFGNFSLGWTGMARRSWGGIGGHGGMLNDVQWNVERIVYWGCVRTSRLSFCDESGGFLNA